MLQSFVVVPYYTEAVTLTFKRLLTTQETELVVYDHFELVLENRVGNEVSPQVVFNNLSANRDKWVAETAIFSGMNNKRKRGRGRTVEELASLSFRTAL